MEFIWQKDERYIKLAALVLYVEGGYSDDPQDPGGPTNMGIAWNYNQPRLKKYGILTPEDLLTKMTKDIARDIYYEWYYLAAECQKLPDIRLAYFHFDVSVNHGKTAAKAMISTLSYNPFYYAAINGQNEALWFRLFMEYTLIRFKRWRTDRNRKRYLEGWFNRYVNILQNALNMTN